MKAFLSTLIKCRSITPVDAGCQSLIAQYLSTLGFTCIELPNPPVSNLLAYIGHGAPFFLFAGHTDVVPEGARDAWHTDPFCLTESDGRLYGRGVADMKGAVVAMIQATEQFLESFDKNKGTIGFLITSGEEGDDFLKGTPYVMDYLISHIKCPDYCLVGEPSSHQRIGDTLRIGRRGSLTAKITCHGQQGHVAYPEHISNPIHHAGEIIHALNGLILDRGCEYFPASSLQITHMNAQGGASNMTPHSLYIQLNIRYNVLHRADTLIKTIEDLLHLATPLPLSIEWQHNGNPFITLPGPFLTKCTEAITECTGQIPLYSTGGGTSDGRFIAPYGIPVVELGLNNHSIHQVNEHITEEDLNHLSTIYHHLLKKIFRSQGEPAC